MQAIRNILVTFWLAGFFACQPEQKTPKKVQHRVAALSGEELNAISGTQLLEAAYRVEQGDEAAFDAAVYDIGNQLSEAVAASVAMSAEEKATMDEYLKAHYKDISAEARKNYLDNVATLPKQTVTQVTSTQHSTRAELLAAALNSTSCSFASFVFIPLGIQLSIPSIIGASYAMQGPCEGLLQGPMLRLGQRIEKAGMVRDIEETSSRLNVLREGLLAELTTAEMLIKVNETETIKRQVKMGSWKVGSWQAAQLDVQYAVLLKYGVDLTQGLKIRHNDKERTITVSMTSARLLTAHLEPEFTNANDGGVPDLDNSHFRHVYEKAQAHAIAQAEKRGIQARAQQQAEQVMALIFQPFLSHYKLQFNYENVQ